MMQSILAALRCVGMLQFQVTSRVAATTARPELIDQADSGSMNSRESPAKPTLWRWSIAEPCGAGVCAAESDQDRLRRLSSDLGAYLVQSAVSKLISPEPPSAKTTRFVR